jgi:uncharacterized protein YjbI with pentapeptide repeats
MTNPPFTPEQEWDAIAWDRQDFTSDDLSGSTFSGCTFTGCDFSGLGLSSTRFEGCRFVECNLSNVTVDHTRFDGVEFEACKLVGLNFGASDPLVFDLRLNRCLLRYVNFSQMRWKKAVVTDCNAVDSDFRGAKLPGADFSRTRFRSCRFHAADLAGADFRWAEGYDLDPRTESLRKAKFSLPEAMNLLAPFEILVD